MVYGVIPAWGQIGLLVTSHNFLYLLCTLKWNVKALTQVLTSKLILAMRNFQCGTGFIMCSYSCHFW